MISCGNIVYVFQNNWRENTDDLQDIVTAELNAKVWSDNCDKYRIQSLVVSIAAVFKKTNDRSWAPALRIVILVEIDLVERTEAL